MMLRSLKSTGIRGMSTISRQLTEEKFESTNKKNKCK
jgi:hypothetical protein